MASTYRKKRSDVIWIRYKDSAGKWKGKPTSYRYSNMGDRRQAELLARKQSEKEAAQRACIGERFDEWVLPWIISKYGALETTTPDRYKRMWRTVSRFLAAEKIQVATQVKRELAGKYLAWRLATAQRNSAIDELKFLSMVMQEAVNREHCLTNPLSKLGLRKEKAKEKLVWSNEDLTKAANHLKKYGTLWQRAAFFLGMYQACRLRQCEIPLTSIRLDLNVIQYPDHIVKGKSGFTQPIDPRFRPILEGLIKEAKDAALTTLCVIPDFASLTLRRTFDRAGLEGHCHHGLRVTWITRAAESGVPESQAMAFCHHASREVHRIYKKLNAVEIAHVPSLISLPAFGAVSAAADGRAAKPGSVLA